MSREMSNTHVSVTVLGSVRCSVGPSGLWGGIES
jgi:hypothetical protein